MRHTLIERLRAADGFAAVAAAAIDELSAHAGVAGVAVEAHLDGHPTVWLGTAPFEPTAARQYIEGGFRTDALLAKLRATPMPATDGARWIAPIVGCGELLGAIRLVAGGNWFARLQHVSMLVSVRLAQLGGIERDHSSLTARQHEVVILVSRGCTNPEIAGMLAISANAVKKHVSRALEMLGVSNRTELAALAPPAITAGQFDPPKATVSWSRDGKSIVVVSSRLTHLAVWNAGVEVPEDLARVVHRNVPWKVDNGRLVPTLVRIHGQVHRGETRIANAEIILIIRKPPDLGSEGISWESTQTQKQEIPVTADELGRFSRDGLTPGEYTITVKTEAGPHVLDVNVSVEDEAFDIDLARASAH
ncbi:MAG: hypothetical protein JWO36_6340 [Myxococcales bacterium]|nr:hypothetical protein [Myxococcales bacterium]